MEQTLERTNPVFSTKLIVGVFFILVGVLLTADNLDILDADGILRYWPAVIVLVGAAKILERRTIFGAVLMFIGAAMLAENAGWIRFDLFDFWPLLLIGGGLAMIGRSVGFRAAPGETGETPGDNIWAILSTRKVAPRTIGQATVGAFMGGVELDLTQAEGDAPVILDVFAWWGGIEIYVPDDWDVVGEVVPFMAGFDITTGTGTRRQLIVRGPAIMSGIEIKRRVS